MLVVQCTNEINTSKISPITTEFCHETLEVEVRYLSTFLSLKSQRRWLFMGGKTGTGKTTLAKSIMRLFGVLRSKASHKLNNERNQIKSKEELEQLIELTKLPLIKFVSAKEIATLASQDPDKYKDIVNTTALIIDDIGIEPLCVKHYGNEFYPLAELLMDRYDRRDRVLTIMTSNLSFADVCETYSERVASRLTEVCAVKVFNGDDFRRM